MRSYEDPCGIARALDVVGERWSLLLIRELVLGPKRFTDLRAGLPGASPNVLSQRLDELEDAHVIRKRTSGTYELTEWGQQLHPLLVQLGHWGAQSPAPRQGQLSVNALLLALETTFVPNSEVRGSIELRLGEDAFGVEVEKKAISITHGQVRKPEAIIITDPATLRAVVFGDRPLGSSEIELRGDKAMARAFLKLFARPKTSGRAAQ